MKKAIITCRAGMGTSTMLTVQVKNVAKKNNWELEVNHTSLDGVGSFNGDFIIALSDVADDLRAKRKDIPIVGIKNMMDQDEITQKLTPLMES